MKAALLELQRALEAERREKEAALRKQGQLEDELAAAQQARIELEGQVRSSAFEQSVATMDEGSKEKRLVDSEREREYLAMRSERLADECETLREQKATLEARLRALEEQVERVNAAIGSVARMSSIERTCGRCSAALAAGQTCRGWNWLKSILRVHTTW